jgi:hypothetical protein
MTCELQEHRPLPRADRSATARRDSAADRPVTRSGDLLRARARGGAAVRERGPMNRVALVLAAGAVAFGAGALALSQEHRAPRLAPSADASPAATTSAAPRPSAPSPTPSTLGLPVSVPSPSPDSGSSAPTPAEVAAQGGGAADPDTDAPDEPASRAPRPRPRPTSAHRPAAQDPPAVQDRPGGSAPAPAAPAHDLSDVCRMAEGKVDPAVLAMCRGMASG